MSGCNFVDLKFLSFSAKGEGTSDEIGIFDDVGCHASAESVVSCEMYEATFPMDLGFVVLELDSCKYT